MANPFSRHWTDEIARVSTRPEYQTAKVRIIDPSAVEKEYDVDAGTVTIIGDGTVYHGQARIIGIRWAVYSGGESQANAKSLKSIRIQLPQDAVGRVRTGFSVIVEESRNTVLTDYVFFVSSDLQGSSDAARTIECSLDNDSKRAI